MVPRAASPSEPIEYSVREKVVLKPVSPPVHQETRSLGSLKSREDVFEGLHYESLIRCLAWEESNWGANIRGDNGRSWGWMQYHKHKSEGSLWQEECVPRGFDDPDDPLQATKCADQLLQKDFSYVCHWSTTEECGIACP